MMVQYVIDCLSRSTAPPWLESADPAVSFTFAGGEKAHSETRILLPLPDTRHERFAVHIVPSEVTPILLDMLREFGLVINADSAHCYSTKLRCRIPVTVLPSGHLALALTPSGNFETTERRRHWQRRLMQTWPLLSKTSWNRDSAPSLRAAGGRDNGFGFHGCLFLSAT